MMVTIIFELAIGKDGIDTNKKKPEIDMKEADDVTK